MFYNASKLRAFFDASTLTKTVVLKKLRTPKWDWQLPEMDFSDAATFDKMSNVCLSNGW